MHRTRTGSLLGLILLAVCSAAFAQRPAKSSGQDAFFRCKDQNGQTHYGDSMPPACSGLDTEVLSDRGTVLRIIEGEQTRSARLEREAAEAKAQKIRDTALQRDRMLLETYLTAEDIERLRDQRLGLLVAQYKITEQNIVNLRERQARLEGQIARFKPYSDNPKAPPLPDHVAEEMVNTVNSLRVYQETLTNNRKEQADIKASFATDLKRFRELKGLK